MNKKDTIDLLLINNSTGRTDITRNYRLINTEKYPEQPSAYVIRYDGYEINRFRGTSSILKIGSATKGVRKRFDNYNRQMNFTADDAEMLGFLDSSQKTNARLMHFLAHNYHPKKIVIDVYYEEDNKMSALDIEKELLKKYLLEHNEAPPLNFGMK